VPSLHFRGFHVLAAVPSAGRSSFAGGPARAPQAAATEGLYARHAAKILSYCLHQLGSREEAEDAVQTTFMNAFRALGRGVVPEAESAWLFKIAENVCLSRRRSSWRRGRIESPSDFDVIEEVVPGPSRQRDELIGIEDALASMPDQQRRAILLREWQGLSYREIGQELEVSQSAVETLIFRARRSLAQGLEQPDLVKKPRRKSLRRALHVIDLGSIAAALKTVLAGSVAVKATAAAVAVTAAAGVASVTPKLEGHSPAPAPVVAPAEPHDAVPALAAAAPAAVSFRERAEVRPATTTPTQAPQRPVAVAERSARPVLVPVAAPRPAPVAAAPSTTPAPAPAAAPPGEQAAQPTSVEPPQPPTVDQPVHVPVPAPVEPSGHESPQPIEVVKSDGHAPAPISEPSTPLPVLVAPVLTVDPHHLKVTPVTVPVVAAPPVTTDPVPAAHG
jgi:RNA polymerase sigma factor (sigma-70 family)